MAKYVAKHKGNPIVAVSFAGTEYKAKDGFIEIPDGHAPAHKLAQEHGLERAE